MPMLDPLGLGTDLILGTLARLTVVGLAALLAVLGAARRGRPEWAATAALAGLLGLMTTTALVAWPWPATWRVAWPSSQSPGSPSPRPAPQTKPSREQIAERGHDQREPSPPALTPAPRWRRQTPRSAPAAAPAVAVTPRAAQPVGAIEPAQPPPGGVATSPSPADRRRWVVALLSGGWAIGLTRLVVSLRALRRRVAQARPIVDPHLGALVAEVQSELGFHQQVSLRESGSVSQAATVGWWRPVLLLPPEWRGWTAVERRIVLTHEIAHIRRGDYAGRLVARVCLIVHFYHPLAYWLADRLRFHQELAADACGIRAAGGRSPYLATLARLALRRDAVGRSAGLNRVLPALDSLFFRRMEMIRTRTDLGRHPAPPQWLTRLSTFALLGLVVAVTTAIRPPTVPAADDSKPTVEVARTPEPTTPPAQPSGVPFDLTHVPSDTVALVGVRPAALLAQEDIRDLMNLGRLDSDFRKELFKLAELGLDPEAVEQVLYAQRRVDFSAAMKDEQTLFRSGVMIIRSRTPIKAEGLRDAWKRQCAKMEVGVLLPDPQTAIIAESGVMATLRQAKPSTPREMPWYDSWAGVERCQIAMAVDAGYARTMLEPALMETGAGGLEMMMFLSPVAPIWDEAKGMSLGLSLVNDQVELVSLNSASTQAGAEASYQTVQALTTLARNAASSVRRPVRKAMILSNGGVEGLLIAKTANLWANQVFQNLRVDRDGTTVRFAARLDVETLLLAGQLLK